MILMFILRVTPARNVLIGKQCYKSDRPDMFFSKIVEDCTKIEVYDVSDRKKKLLNVSEINRRNHRMIINGKRYFICSITDIGDKKKAI
ncbi:hypothetical protein Clocl_3351 [Acetivibrio clariflavus DSM 19732]|uniref:Uncharacterized protein n=2 Tax=Acetivibrio clariflavus TaxID=288965 RepID=G8LXD2_ACECE|nr:hypothetical protein Clocl_3351 [Acetivibrio clariflavus DSM 19732]